MSYNIALLDHCWSYSQLKCFDECPLSYYLHYLKDEPKAQHFFTQYGSYMHKIHELVLKGEISEQEASTYYLIHYTENITAKPMSEKIYTSYFNTGLKYWKEYQNPDNVVSVEQKFYFNIDEKEFVGIADLILSDDGDLILVDHKSKDIKPRSKKGTLKSDKDLDLMLRQLYIYCKPIKDKYGKFPKKLVYNCFRAGNIIEENFDEEKYREAIQWATDKANEIMQCDDWYPNPNKFYCHYICDMKNSCEYSRMEIT